MSEQVKYRGVKGLQQLYGPVERMMLEIDQLLLIVQ